jgi:hypothetical protein
MTVGADADVVDGWLVRPFRAGPGLDGPAGILQGGFAASVPLVAARMADRFGAPLTAIDARLHAPTPLDRELQLALRPGGGGPADHTVELRDGDTLLVSATVELAGHEPSPQVADLVELATVPLPPQSPQDIYPVCWMCGSAPHHPHAQRCTFGYHAGAVITPWAADAELADGRAIVDPMVVAAMLDCPGVFSAQPSLVADGWAGCLLGGFHLRMFGDAPAYEALRLVARHDGTDGRKVNVRTALVDEAGTVYAMAQALHVAVREVPSLG